MCNNKTLNCIHMLEHYLYIFWVKVIPFHGTPPIDETRTTTLFAIYWSLRERAAQRAFHALLLLYIGDDAESNKISKNQVKFWHFPAYIKNCGNCIIYLFCVYNTTSCFLFFLFFFLFGVCVWPTPPGVTKLDNTLRGECVDPGATWKTTTTQSL